jgi:hypothetical protein
MQTIILDIKDMGTEELEAVIDSRYEADAPQDELDALETEYAARVSEDDLNMTEEDPNMREAHDMGVDFEEWLAKEYFEYTHPPERAGGREDNDYFTSSCFNEFMTINPRAGIKRKDILEAAKDIYEYKRNLIQRYKSSNKFSNIPDKFLNIWTSLCIKLRHHRGACPYNP